LPELLRGAAVRMSVRGDQCASDDTPRCGFCMSIHDDLLSLHCDYQTPCIVRNGGAREEQGLA
jgi:hypothetical protein